MKRAMGCFGLLLLGLTLRAEIPLDEALVQTREDVAASTRELNQLRDRIQSERLPMTSQLADMNRQASALREKVKRLRRAAALREQEAAELARDLNQLEQEKDFIDGVFEAYRREWETRVLPAEWAALSASMPEAPEEMWDWSLHWLKQKQRGYGFEGQVLNDEGRAETGEIRVLGPLATFVNDTQSGLVLSRPGSLLPGLYAMPGDREAFSRFARGEPALLPLDVSGGDAMKVAAAKPGLIAHVKQGGVVVLPLLLIGVLALILSLRKAWDLQRMQVQLSAEQRQRLRELDEAGVPQLMQDFAKEAQPLASLLLAALQHRQASRTHLEEILHEHVLAVLPRLERSLGMLAVFGGVAPLLGLLGTVTGMIHTFQLVTLFGSGNAKTLSGGISEALVTTEIGLVIAIPILLVHAALARRAKRLLADMEQSAVALVNLLKSDGNAG